MAKKQVVTPEEPTTPTTPEVPEVPTNSGPLPVKAKKGEPITVKFRDHKGEPTERTFSPADHGEDYAKLAESFKEKHASRLIK